MPVIAAVDTDQRAGSVITEAAKLADAFATELHVLHVTEYEDIKEPKQGSAKQTKIEELEDDVSNIAEKHTDEYVPVGLIGSPPAEIVGYAKRHEAEYIVLGTRKRSPVGKALFGSTAQRVMLNSPCPVVVNVDKE